MRTATWTLLLVLSVSLAQTQGTSPPLNYGLATSLPVLTDPTDIVALTTGDIDGDGADDIIVSTESQETRWYPNSEGSGRVWGSPQIIHGAPSPPAPAGIAAIRAGDVDNDQDVDVFVAYNSAQSIYWHENDGSGAGGTWVARRVANVVAPFVDIALADVDMNGRVDVVGVGNTESFSWFENPVNPTQVFEWPRRFINPGFNLGGPPSAVAVGDLGGTPNPDVVISSVTGNRLVIFISSSTNGLAYSAETRVGDTPGPLQIANLDGDQDNDIVYVSGITSGVTPSLKWLRNSNGALWEEVVIDGFMDVSKSWLPVSFCVDDYDSDGTIDVVVPADASAVEMLVLYSNTEGTGETWTETTAGEGAPTWPLQVISGDLDGIGGPDLISAFNVPYDNSVFGAWGLAVTLAGAPSASASHLIDGASLALIGPDGVDASTDSEIQLLLQFRFPGDVPAPTPIPLTAIDVTFTPSLVHTLSPGPLSSDGAYQVVLTFATFSGQEHQLDIALSGSPLGVSPYTLRVSTKCAPGSKAVGTRCEACGSGTYSNATNAPDCTPCPLGSTSGLGSNTWTNCTCLPGTWLGLLSPSDRVESTPCLPCPPNGVCGGGESKPTPVSGYFESPPGSGVFLACRRDGCPGGTSALCKPGYTGFLCGTCQEGYYSQSPTVCAKCPKASVALFWLVVLGVVGIGIVSGVVVVLSLERAEATDAMDASLAPGGAFGSQAEDKGEGGGAAEGTRRELAMQQSLRARERTVPLAFSLVLTAFQICSLIAQSDLKWGKASSAVLRMFGWFMLDSRVLATECETRSFHVTYALSILLPLLGLGVAVGVVVLASVLGRLGLSLLGAAEAAVFALSPLLYIPLARSSLSLLDCTRLPGDGQWVLDADTGTRCFDSAWYGSLPLALVVILGFVVGLPVAIGLRLWMAQRNGRSSNGSGSGRGIASIRFRSLTRHLTSRFYFGEVLATGRRLFVVLVATFLSRTQALLIGLFFALLLGGIVFILSYRPYYGYLHNVLDTRLSLVLLVILLIGAGSYAERESPDVWDTPFFVATLIAVLTLFLVAIHGIVIDIRDVFSEKRHTSVVGSDRRARLVKLLETEVSDLCVDVDPQSLHSVLTSLGGIGVGGDGFELVSVV